MLILSNVKSSFVFYLIFLHRFLTNLASIGGLHEISRRAACRPRAGQHWSKGWDLVWKRGEKIKDQPFSSRARIVDSSWICVPGSQGPNRRGSIWTPLSVAVASVVWRWHEVVSVASVVWRWHNVASVASAVWRWHNDVPIGNVVRHWYNVASVASVVWHWPYDCRVLDVNEWNGLLEFGCCWHNIVSVDRVAWCCGNGFVDFVAFCWRNVKAVDCTARGWASVAGNTYKYF